MTVPAELHYTPEHEWVAISGPIASVGITDHAQRALGDVVFVSVPAPGSRVAAGEPCDGMDAAQPALCHEHAASASQSVQVVKVTTPSPPMIVFPDAILLLPGPYAACAAVAPDAVKTR